MSCEVAALPFQAHANYGTWSIDFGVGPGLELGTPHIIIQHNK
jgi:hypothetical protein